jgi:hypothetical protein
MTQGGEGCGFDDLEIKRRKCGCRTRAATSMVPTTDLLVSPALRAIAQDYRKIDLKGAHTSNGSPVRLRSVGSSFSGLFTRVEMGHIVIGSDGYVYSIGSEVPVLHCIVTHRTQPHW